MLREVTPFEEACKIITPAEKEAWRDEYVSKHHRSLELQRPGFGWIQIETSSGEIVLYHEAQYENDLRKYYENHYIKHFHQVQVLLNSSTPIWDPPQVFAFLKTCYEYNDPNLVLNAIELLYRRLVNTESVSRTLLSDINEYWKERNTELRKKSWGILSCFFKPKGIQLPPEQAVKLQVRPSAAKAKPRGYG